MDGNECVPALHFSFETFGFVLGDAHSDQGAGKTTQGASDRGARERGHDWTGSDEWSPAWDCQRANSGKPTESATNGGASAGARGSAFGHLSGVIDGKIFRAAAIGHEH